MTQKKPVEIKRTLYEIAAEKDVQYILKNFVHIDDIQAYIAKQIAATNFSYDYVDALMDEIKYQTEEDSIEGADYILLMLLLHDEQFWMDVYNRETAIDGLGKKLVAGAQSY